MSAPRIPPGRPAASQLAIAIAAGFMALPSAAYAALPGSAVRPDARPGDMVDVLGQWLVDARGTHWTPPHLVAASPVVPASFVAAPADRRPDYDAYGNRRDFELAAPPPVVRMAALDFPTPAAAAPVAARAPQPNGVFERLVAGAKPPSILMAAAPGESAEDIEARVDRQIRDSLLRPDLVPEAPIRADATARAEGASPKMPAKPAAPAAIVQRFDAESAEIDPDLGPDIDAFARWLAADASARARVTGTASVRDGETPDDSQAYARARRLAESRALALRQELLDRGVAAAAVSIDARVARGAGAHAAELAAETAARAASPPAASAPAAAVPDATAPLPAPGGAKKTAPAGARPLAPPRRLVPPATGA